MFKKLVLWSLYAAFLGLLLGGGLYRTSVKLVDTDGEQTQNHGGAARGQENGKTLEDGSIEVNPGGEEGQSAIIESIMVDAQVLEFSVRGLSLQLSDGGVFTITGRAWRYAQSFGFTAQNGDVLWLEGFDENGHFEVMSMTNLRNDLSVSLRDETGHPLWNGN
jgi:hypothetical protein